MGGTVAALLHSGRESLAESSTPSLDAQVLLGHALDRPRSWLLAHDMDRVQPEHESAYRALITQRARGVPIAYLRGHVEWFGMELVVTPDVLIPRPETELVLEEAVRLGKGRPLPALADVGTGSGAIAIGLARSLPSAMIVATDTSRSALQVAEGNAGLYGLESRISFVYGSLLDPVRSEPDVIVANLPYLSSSMMRELPVGVQFEPQEALWGGETGLELYEALLMQSRVRAWTSTIVFEIDPRQSTIARTLVESVFPHVVPRILRDYAGHPRIVVVEQ